MLTLCKRWVMVGVLVLSIQRWTSVRPTSGNGWSVGVDPILGQYPPDTFSFECRMMLVGSTTLFISSRATCENIQVYFFFTVKTNLKLYLKGTENKTNKFCKIKLCCIIALKCRIQEADPEIISYSLTKQLEQIKVFTA